MCVGQQLQAGGKKAALGALAAGSVEFMRARRDGGPVSREMFTDPKGFRDRRRAAMGGAPLGGQAAPLGG